jgi:hypothetical protein
MLVLAATMALPAFAGGNSADVPPDFAGGGGPDNPPNGFGTVVSQKASTYHDVGKHSSSQEEPRQGVGNVARNDGAEGDHPGDPGCFVGALDNTVGVDPHSIVQRPPSTSWTPGRV